MASWRPKALPNSSNSTEAIKIKGETGQPVSPFFIFRFPYHIFHSSLPELTPPAMTNEKCKRLIRPVVLRQHAGGSPDPLRKRPNPRSQNWRQTNIRPKTTFNRKDQKNAQKVHLFAGGCHGL